MKHFDEEFQTALRSAVEKIEQDSGVEIVATLSPRADRYFLRPLVAGLLVFLSVYTYMMFVPKVFHYQWLYLETLIAFLLAAGTPLVFPGLNRLLYGEKILRRKAELQAASMFHHAGIYETRKRVGLLVSFSWYEREAVVIADTGAVEMIPPDLLQAFEADCRQAIRSKEAPDAIIRALKGSAKMFANYIPRGEDDVNELPDDLWMH